MHNLYYRPYEVNNICKRNEYNMDIFRRKREKYVIVYAMAAILKNERHFGSLSNIVKDAYCYHHAMDDVFKPTILHIFAVYTIQNGSNCSKMYV